MNHHIIYRQKTTITVAKESEVYAVQSVINDVIKNELPQLLQDVFDSIIPEGDIIRMESLQLDLGVLPAHNIRQAFKEQVVEKIRKAITVKKENAATENDVIIIHKEQSLRETFLYFLQYGVQPWFTVVKRREEWESGMQQWFAKTDWQKIVLWLRQNHQHQPVVIDRLVHQFSDDFLESIINNTISFGNENWKDIYRDLTALFTKNKGQAEALVRPKLLSLCLSSFLNTDSLPDALYDVVRTGIESYRAEVNISTSHSTKLSGEVIRTKILADIFERVNREQSQALKRDQNEMSIHTNDAILPGEFSSTEKLFKKNETLSEYNENKFSPGGIDGNSATENTTAEFSNQDAESKDFDPGKIKGNDSNISNISSSQYNENEFLPAGNDNNSTAKNATPEFSNRDTESKNMILEKWKRVIAT